jgi:GcrA cell cycle regulator
MAYAEAARAMTGTCLVCDAPCRRGSNTCSRKCWEIRCGCRIHDPDFVAAVTKLWAEGHSQAEIGRRLGVTKHVIAGFRRKHMELGDRPRGSAGTPQAAPAPQAAANLALRERHRLAAIAAAAAAAKPKPGKRPVLICEPEGASRSQPGRYCSAHPEIRWHPSVYLCRCAA